MPHFRVDDAFHSHPKAQRVGDDAIGLWVRAGSFCMAYLTDGFVPEWWVKQQPKGAAKAQKLVSAGLWHDGAESNGEQGYQFHEFVGPGRQDSREKIEADRELARKRKQKSRRESQPESRMPSQRDTPRDNHRESRPESRRSPGYTQPNPTQPIRSLVDSSGGVTSVDARDPDTPTVCARHPNGNPRDEPCNGCRAVAQAAARAELAAKADAERAAAAQREADAVARAMAIVECDQCDDDGYVGTQVCDHREHATAETRAAARAQVMAALAKDGDQ